MRLQHLRSLAAIVQHGSFTRAAEHLYLSQPSLSHQIRHLERELAVELLVRGNGAVRLTAVGEQLFPRILRILAEVDTVERHAEELRDAAAGKLSVALVPVASEVLMPEILPAFTAAYPGVALEVSEIGSEAAAEAVRRGRADLGIAAWSPALPDWYHDLTAETLTLGRLVVCVPEGSPLAGREQVSLRELAGEPLVLFREGYLTRALVAAVAPFNLTQSTVLSTDNGLSARHMVASGLGIAFLSSIAGALGSGASWIGSTTLPLADPIVPIGLCTLTARQAYLSHAARAFIGLAQERARALQQPTAPAPRPRSQLPNSRSAARP